MEIQPNVIFIITDQQRADTVGTDGDWAITPALDALAQDGVLFQQAYCCGAACVASRAALFTGMYGHNTGVYSNKCRWGHQQTWLHDFRDAGYRVVNVGKMHHRDTPAAFHERYIVENKSSHLSYDQWNRFLWQSGLDVPRRHETIENWARQLNSVTWEHDEAAHADVFTGDMALRFIDRWDCRAPLFLQIGFPGPHEPYDPPARFLKMYESRPMPERIQAPGELDTKPPVQTTFKQRFATANHEHQIDFANVTDEDIARMRRHYAAGMTAIDEKVGQILEALEHKGLLENSIVIFTSDHGDNLGDHHLPYKWFMYDTITHIPLIVRTPKTVGKGRVDTALFSHIDLGPTLLEMAGIPIPSRLDGCSRLARLTGSAPDDAPEIVFAEENYLVMARTATHKLVHYIDRPTGELYDLVEDPHELVNLYDSEQYLPVRQQLEGALFEWLVKSCYHNSGYKNQAGPMYQVKWLD